MFKATPFPYQAGKIDGRTDVLEDLSKFTSALLVKAERERLAGDNVAAQKSAEAGAAIASFTQDYIRRMREGIA